MAWALQAGATAAVDLGLVGLAGSLVARWMLAPASSAWALRREAGVRRVWRLSLLGSWLAAAAWLWVQAVVMTEQPAWQAWSALGTVALQTHVGRAWLVGVAALAALTAGSVWASWAAAHRLLPSPDRLAPAVLGVALLAASRTAAGHAGSATVWWPALVGWVHVVGVGVWAGGVWLAAGVVLAGPPPAAGAERLAAARGIERLSAASTWALTGIFATGLVSAWRGLDGSTAPVLASPYGQLLVGKLAAVLLAAALGAHNRFAVMPPLLQALAASAAPATAPLNAFRRILRIEAALLAVAVLAAAALGVSAQPAAWVGT